MTSTIMSTGAWRHVMAHAVVRRHVKHMVEITKTFSSAWGHVGCLMVNGLAWLDGSFDDLHAYMICVLVRGQKRQIRWWQWSWRRRLSFCSGDSTLRSLTAAWQSGEALERLIDQQKLSTKTRLQNTKKLEQWLWYYVRNTEWIVLYFANERIYMSAFI